MLIGKDQCGSTRDLALIPGALPEQRNLQRCKVFRTDQFYVHLLRLGGNLSQDFDWNGKTAIRRSGWALWHIPAFFFPGMPQQHMPPIAFLLMVAAFGIFLALLFNRTRGRLVSTMLAHFSFNMSLAVGGGILGSVFIWTLAFIFSIVAIVALAKLPAQPIRIAKTASE
jgi:hypothetical protein